MVQTSPPSKHKATCMLVGACEIDRGAVLASLILLATPCGLQTSHALQPDQTP